MRRKNQNVGGSGGNWHGFGVGGIGHSNTKANVVINARIVNVDTGEIVAVGEGAGQSSRSSTSLLGGGGNWRGFGGGNVDFGSSNFQNTIIGEATKAAVDKLTADLVSSSSKVTVRTIKVDGLVAAVDGGQIVLNVGAKAGVKVGDQLQVLRVTKEIKDPATGAVHSPPHHHRGRYPGHRCGRCLLGLRSCLRLRLPGRRSSFIRDPVAALASMPRPPRTPRGGRSLARLFALPEYAMP